MQGYPQQQAYGQQQQIMAGGYMSPEELEKQKKKRERQLRHERKLKQQHDEGTSLVKWLCIGAVMNTGLLIIPIFGNSWTQKSFVGLGVKMLTIRTSLFMIDVEVDCGKNWLEDQLCALGEKMHGVHSLHQGQAIMCAMTSHACSVMDKLYYGSFILFFFFAVAVLSNIVAGVFLSYYWYGTPLEKIRKYSLIFFFATPCATSFGIMIWTCYIPNLAELPMAWTHTLTMLTGTELFALKEVHSFPYGWCYVLAWLVTLLLSAQCLAWTCCFREHTGEEHAEDEEELKKLAIEDPYLMEQLQNQGNPHETTPLTSGVSAQQMGQSYGGGGQYPQQQYGEQQQYAQMQQQYQQPPPQPVFGLQPGMQQQQGQQAAW